MIAGGHEYVWAAYGVSWAGFIGYAVSLFRRLAAAKQEAGWQQDEPS